MTLNRVIISLMSGFNTSKYLKVPMTEDIETQHSLKLYYISLLD